MNFTHKLYLTVGLAFVSGASLGTGMTILLFKKKLDAKYEEMLTEENKKTRDFFEQRYKVGEYASPLDAATALIDKEAGEALAKYANQKLVADVEALKDKIDHEVVYGNTIPATAESLGKAFIEVGVPPQDVNYHNVFQEQGDDARLDPSLRDTSKPYIIHEDEWSEAQAENIYDHVTLTYYAGDNVLCDDEDDQINKVDEVVGFKNLDMFGVGVEDPNVVFIRNEILKTDFEITRREDEYKVTVLGFKPTNLQHSDEPMTRRRRLQD